MDGCMDGWMDDMQFYVLFNSVSAIPGQWKDDIIMKSGVQWDPVYGINISASSWDQTWTARSVGQHLIY